MYRLYLPEDAGEDGYPLAWHQSVKHLVRQQAGNRCVRCGHPYEKGEGEWSACDEKCSHGPPIRWKLPDQDEAVEWRETPLPRPVNPALIVQGQWRILTVHHLNMNKLDCRWWNLVSLCQRCHLQVQLRVRMERPWDKPHREWFKPYAAGWYAARYLGADMSREEVMDMLDELLDLELRQFPLFDP